jgi:hypothetical protein
VRCDYILIQQYRDRGFLDQFWFEVDQMYQAYCGGRQEFRWWISAEESGLLDKVSEEYIRHTPGEILLRKYFDMDAPAVHWVCKDDILDTLGINPKDGHYGTRSNEVFDAIRRITDQKHTRKMVDNQRKYGFMMPQTKIQKMVPALAVVQPQEHDFL